VGVDTGDGEGELKYSLMKSSKENSITNYLYP
jgi:hypothetical protein